MTVKTMRAPLTLRSQPLTVISTVGGTMARGRAARKAPRRTNPATPPRPRCAASARFRPQDPCRAPISGAACAISPGNPSLRRSSCPSSPPAPPRTSSGRHLSAGRISAILGILMQQNDSLRDSEISSGCVECVMTPSQPDRAVSAKPHGGFIQITQSILAQGRDSGCNSHNH